MDRAEQRRRHVRAATGRARRLRCRGRRLASGQTSALPGRRDRRRQGRHRRVRRRRRVRGAQQRRRHVCAGPAGRRGLRVRSRLAGGPASPVRRGSHRRRQGRHHRVRQRRRLCRAEQGQRHVHLHAGAGDQRLRRRRRRLAGRPAPAAARGPHRRQARGHRRLRQRRRLRRAERGERHLRLQPGAGDQRFRVRPGLAGRPPPAAACGSHRRQARGHRRVRQRRRVRRA